MTKTQGAKDDSFVKINKGEAVWDKRVMPYVCGRAADAISEISEI